jgi:hypothetical protein
MLKAVAGDMIILGITKMNVEKLKEFVIMYGETEKAIAAELNDTFKKKDSGFSTDQGVATMEQFETLLTNLQRIEEDNGFNIFSRDGFFHLSKLRRIRSNPDFAVLDEAFFERLELLDAIYTDLTELGVGGDGLIKEEFVKKMQEHSYIVHESIIQPLGDEKKAVLLTQRGTLIFD